MGWLWSNGGSSATKDTLDPSLRDFLENEAPSSSKPTLPSKPAPQPAKPTAVPEAARATPAVPPQSQFQDGRYADLWKGYTPQHILEDRGKSEQDKLKDIVDAYNDRKRDVGQIALENCALEYMEQFECFKSPNWYQTATICHAETRRFNRCYELQAKFLKALGYLSMESRSREDAEKIQMHADKLYQQLKEQERLIEKAKEDGQPIPQFESVLSKENMARAVSGQSLVNKLATGKTKALGEEDAVWSRVDPGKRAEYAKKIAELPPEDQEIEKRALEAELLAQGDMARKVGAIFVEESINRMKRKEAGKSTVGDTIKHLWGWK